MCVCTGMGEGGGCRWAGARVQCILGSEFLSSTVTATAELSMTPMVHSDITRDEGKQNETPFCVPAFQANTACDSGTVQLAIFFRGVHASKQECKSMSGALRRFLGNPVFALVRLGSRNIFLFGSEDGCDKKSDLKNTMDAIRGQFQSVAYRHAVGQFESSCVSDLESVLHDGPGHCLHLPRSA